MHRRLRLRSALLLLSTLLPGAALADWHTGVGGSSSRDGRSPEIGPDTPDVRWEEGRSALVAQQGVAEGSILVTSRIQSFTIPTGTWVVAQDLDDGGELWAIQLPYDFPGSSWRSRVTAIRDGVVYATRAGNTNADPLYALDAADGTILWDSDALITEGSTESIAFAPDGDPIVGNQSSLVRIESTDGSTVWEVPRSCPTSSGCQATVFGDRVYIWQQSPGGPVVSAFDLATGDFRYSSPSISGGLVQQVGLFCGPDGTVYAPRTQNNPVTDFLVSLTDTGTGFDENWRVPLGYCPFASFGIALDGSVYAYSTDFEVVKLDASTGTELAASDPIVFDSSFSPRMAVDGEGKVYLTNGGFDSGRVYCFDADLDELWSEPVFRVNVGGPVMGEGGIVVVCGTGDVVRAYGGDASVDVASTISPVVGLAAPHPNPARTGTSIPFVLDHPASVVLEVIDPAGRRVRALTRRGFEAGRHRVSWDGKDDAGAPVSAGVYVVSLDVGGSRSSRKVTVVR